MKSKKILTIGMSLAIAMGITACDRKKDLATKITPPANPTNQEKTALDNNYVEQYSKLYEDYKSGVKNYEMYLTPQGVNEYYKTNKYPGNKEYLENVKTACKNDKQEMQAFVNSLKNDAKTKDTDLKKMNNDLIAEGEETIANIDKKLKKLDKISPSEMNKPQAEFIKLVNKTTAVKGEDKNNFTQMLEKMNKKLDIKPNELNNINTPNNNVIPNTNPNNNGINQGNVNLPNNNNNIATNPNPNNNNAIPNTKPNDTTNNNNNVTSSPKPNNDNNVTPNPKPNDTTNNNNTQSFSAFQKEVVDLVNVERTNRGLKAINLDAKISNVATIKCQDMIDKNYFQHTSPTYGSPFDMMKNFGITYKSAGENIAMGQRSPKEVVTAWMNSQGHRENILNKSFTDIGVGVAKTSNNTIYWTQMFVGR